MNGNAMSRRRRWILRLGLLAVPACLFALLEGVFAWKFAGDFPGSSLAIQGQYRFVRAPHRHYANNPGYIRHRDGVTYRYNNFGFRDEEDLGPKAPNEFRVFVVGGSTAYGERASERGQYQLISGQKTYPSSMTISSYLEAELGSRLPGKVVNVVNAAVVSYRIHHDYLQYLELLRGLEPDLLVAIDGQNELFSVANPFSYANSRLVNLTGGPVTQLLLKHSYMFFYFGLMFRESALFERLLGYNAAEFSDEELARADVPEIRAAYRRNIESCEAKPEALDGIMKVYDQFWHAARLDGVPILFTTQPVLTLDAAKKLTPTEEKLLVYEKYAQYEQCGVALLAQRLTERAAKNDGFHFVSLLDVFRDYAEEAYTDYCHLTPGANRHLARRLAVIVMSRPGLLKRVLNRQWRRNESGALGRPLYGLRRSRKLPVHPGGVSHASARTEDARGWGHHDQSRSLTRICHLDAHGEHVSAYRGEALAKRLLAHLGAADCPVHGQAVADQRRGGAKVAITGSGKTSAVDAATASPLPRDSCYGGSCEPVHAPTRTNAIK